MKIAGYKVNRKHRDQTAKADCTQWTVDEWEEIRLFTVAKSKMWVCPKNCLWVTHKNNGHLCAIGSSGVESAYIAKFVVDHNHEWHGYPVTPLREADRPPTTILDSWRAEGLINKAQQGKIIKGKFGVY